MPSLSQDVNILLLLAGSVRHLVKLQKIWMTAARMLHDICMYTMCVAAASANCL